MHIDVFEPASYAVEWMHDVQAGQIHLNHNARHSRKGVLPAVMHSMCRGCKKVWQKLWSSCSHLKHKECAQMGVVMTTAVLNTHYKECVLSRWQGAISLHYNIEMNHGPFLGQLELSRLCCPWGLPTSSAYSQSFCKSGVQASRGSDT